MDADEERDYADQDPLSDMDMEEDAKILATLLKHIPSCIFDIRAYIIPITYDITYDIISYPVLALRIAGCFCQQRNP